MGGEGDGAGGAVLFDVSSEVVGACDGAFFSISMYCQCRTCEHIVDYLTCVKASDWPSLLPCRCYIILVAPLYPVAVL